MDLVKFAKIAESLRQYRRAELKDFETEVGAKPVDQLYVDPLPGNAVLQSVLSSNTTFLLGRKGTGKSTVFAKAQSVLREQKKLISIYVDVKSLYDIMSSNEIPDDNIDDLKVSTTAFRAQEGKRGQPLKKEKGCDWWRKFSFQGLTPTSSLYGLYANSKGDDLDRCRHFLGQPPVEKPQEVSWQECCEKLGDRHPERCPTCGCRLVIGREIPKKRLRPEMPPLRTAA